MSAVSKIGQLSYYVPVTITKVKDRITSLFVPFYQEHDRVQKIHNSISQNPAYSLTEHLMLEQHVISYIMEKALTFNDKTSQVDAAMSLLKCAITKATHLSFGDLSKKIDELKIEIACLENHLLHNENGQSFAKYQQKRTELKEAKQQLATKQAKLDHIHKIEAISLQVKRTGFAQAGSNTKEWLHTQAKLHILSNFIAAKRQELDLPIGINKTLIDSII